jgi:hypothetical protein
MCSMHVFDTCRQTTNSKFHSCHMYLVLRALLDTPVYGLRSTLACCLQHRHVVSDVHDSCTKGRSSQHRNLVPTGFARCSDHGQVAAARLRTIHRTGMWYSPHSGTPFGQRHMLYCTLPRTDTMTRYDCHRLARCSPTGIALLTP